MTAAALIGILVLSVGFLVVAALLAAAVVGIVMMVLRRRRRQPIPAWLTTMTVTSTALVAVATTIVLSRPLFTVETVIH